MGENILIRLKNCKDLQTISAIVYSRIAVFDV